MSFWKNPKNYHGIKPNLSKPRIETVTTKKNASTPGQSSNEKKGLLKKPTANSSKLPRDDLKNTARALSASPALKPIASPSHSNGNSNAADQAKVDRAPLVHELAIKPQTIDHLREKWQGKPEDFNKALEKVADQESGKWVLRARAWQELDVWNYDYDPADREAVISTAQKKFDKARISPSDPLWEKLVPKHERGQGKGAGLSKVQKRIVEGPAAASAKVPKIAVNRAEDSSNSSKDNDDASSDKSKGGESMARTSSSKGKKASASEAQAKRLLSKTKASTPKTSPSKGKGTQANGKKVLSAEIVENSDSSGDEAPTPAAQTKAVPKPAKPAEKPKTTEKTVPKTKPTAPTPKPAPKPAAKPAPKRSLPDDDDSSSSSGLPMSNKRFKASKPLPASQQRKPRPDLKQPPRDYSHYNSHKNTSPTKSSPLASSPPTNASDMSSSSDDRLAASSKKRKADDDGRLAAAKRHLSEQLIQRAQRFKNQYTRYKNLHFEVARMTHPPQNKLDELITMHERLKKMKQKIYDEQQSLVRD